MEKGFFLFCLLCLSLRVEVVWGDGHTHFHSVTASSDDKEDAAVPPPPPPVKGTVTTVQTSSPGNGNSDATFASIANVLGNNPALAAAAAQALGGGYDYGAPPVAPPHPPVPYPPPAFPWGGLGFGKGLHFGIDAGAGAGVGGFGAYYPIIEKVIAVIGGGILILLIIAFIQGSLAPGGFLNTFGASFSKAFSGSAALDAGPFHSSVAGAASGSTAKGIQVGGGSPNEPVFVQNTLQGIDNGPPRGPLRNQQRW